MILFSFTIVINRKSTSQPSMVYCSVPVVVAASLYQQDLRVKISGGRGGGCLNDPTLFDHPYCNEEFIIPLGIDLLNISQHN